MIKLEKVNKWYGEHHVLKDVDLSVARGEVVVVCGPSGSGKSTMIRTINRLEPIEKGRILIDGADIYEKGANLNALRQKIGFVFQQFNLFPHMSVLENVIFAPVNIRKQPRKQAVELARSLLDLASRFGERRARSTDICITLKISQQELGDLVGATRESVNKHLSDWTRQGFLRLQAGRMIISDIDSVRRLARVAED